MQLKLKYNIKFLGVYNYYGDAVQQHRYIEWIKENCKGRWNYYSEDVKVPKHFGRVPIDWPMFYTMIFYFSHKKDYERFKERFI